MFPRSRPTSESTLVDPGERLYPYFGADEKTLPGHSSSSKRPGSLYPILEESEKNSHLSIGFPYRPDESVNERAYLDTLPLNNPHDDIYDQNAEEFSTALSQMKNNKQKLRKLWKSWNSDTYGQWRQNVVGKDLESLRDLDRELEVSDFWDFKGDELVEMNKRLWKQLSKQKTPLPIAKSSLPRANQPYQPYHPYQPYQPYQQPYQPPPQQPYPQELYKQLPHNVPPYSPYQTNFLTKTDEIAEMEKREEELRSSYKLYGKDGGYDNRSVEVPSKAVDVHITPGISEDVTLHLELDTKDDLEDLMEEFSRLRRLGRFYAAKAHFERHLRHFLDNAYIRCQYAECLTEMRDFGTLSEIAAKYPPIGQAPEGNTELYWIYLLSAAQTQATFDFPPEIEQAIQVCLPAWNQTVNWPALDSTEVQLLIRTMGSRGSYPKRRRSETFSTLYTFLRNNECIWEFKDLFESLQRIHGLSQAIEFLFEGRRLDLDNPSRVIEIVQQDWNATPQDSTSSLALLEIFTHMSLASASVAEASYDLKAASTYFEAARRYATSLATAGPQNLRSRAYLRWVIAQVLLQQHGMAHSTGSRALLKHLTSLPGVTVNDDHIFPYGEIYLYAPDEDETPHWSPAAAGKSRHEKTIQTVLRISRELGDIDLQAACLQLLIYQSPDPHQLLAELSNMWVAVGDRRRQIQTCLYRFVVMKPSDSRENLRRDILALGEVDDNELTFTKNLILRALSTSTHEKQVYFRRAQECANKAREDDEEIRRRAGTRFEDNEPVLSLPTSRSKPHELADTSSTKANASPVPYIAQPWSPEVVHRDLEEIIQEYPLTQLHEWESASRS